jgi:diguanylate cyclase (GGDEF)-like protein
MPLGQDIASGRAHADPLFPNFNWEIAHKFQTLIFYLGVPLIVTFFREIFPLYFRQRTIFSCLVLLTPVRIFSVVTPGFQFFTLCVIGYLLLTFIKIVRQKNRDVWLIIVGALAIILTSLNDIIFLSVWMNDYNHAFLQRFIRTDNLSAVGQLIFVFMNSVVLARLYSNSLQQEEKLTQELTMINQNLDDLVKKRTQALDASRKELEKANLSLEQMTRKDPLTGLWNRRHFDAVIHTEWRRCLRYQKPIAVMIFDIDYFKQYNDCYGHVAGDACLIQIAQTASELFKRASDLVIRLGGEEFAVVMPELGKDEAIRMAGHLLQKMEELDIPHKCSPLCPRVTVSIGVTSNVPEFHESFEELLLMADKALYQAKSAGRNQYQYLP